MQLFIPNQIVSKNQRFLISHGKLFVEDRKTSNWLGRLIFHHKYSLYRILFKLNTLSKSILNEKNWTALATLKNTYSAVLSEANTQNRAFKKLNCFLRLVFFRNFSKVEGHAEAITAIDHILKAQQEKKEKTKQPNSNKFEEIKATIPAICEEFMLNMKLSSDSSKVGVRKFYLDQLRQVSLQAEELPENTSPRELALNCIEAAKDYVNCHLTLKSITIKDEIIPNPFRVDEDEADTKILNSSGISAFPTIATLPLFLDEINKIEGVELAFKPCYKPSLQDLLLVLEKFGLGTVGEWEDLKIFNIAKLIEWIVSHPMLRRLPDEFPDIFRKVS